MQEKSVTPCLWIHLKTLRPWKGFAPSETNQASIALRSKSSRLTGLSVPKERPEIMQFFKPVIVPPKPGCRHSIRTPL